MGAITKIINGESGSTIASRLWAINKFDFVVESQADMDVLAAYSGGEYDAILIKKGSYSLSINASSSTLDGDQFGDDTVLVFENGASINFSGDDWLFDSVLKNFSEIINPTMTFSGTVTSMSGAAIFYNCDKISDLTLTLPSIASVVSTGSSVFRSCDSMSNPTVNIVSDGYGYFSTSCYIFDECDGLSAPKLNFTGDKADITGWDTYNSCTNILFPDESILGEVGNVSVYSGVNTGIQASTLVAV